jgi:cytochrome c2
VSYFDGLTLICKKDLSNARSTWPATFYLVATGRKDPKNGRDLRDRCEICHEGTTSSGKDYRVWYVYPNWT